MGNLLWQQEAAEFIEQCPQRRRPHEASLLLRQSASAGTLYRKPETVVPVLNKRASGGELLTTQQRHQRDLFSGDLGIPDVHSHVGTIVHTFENMALQRKLAERQREQLEREHSKYLAEMMAMQAATSTETHSPANSSNVNTTTATTKRNFIPSSGTHSTNNNSNNKFQQLKKKTQETRQKIIQQILQNHPMHKDVTKIQSTPSRYMKATRQASSNSEVYYRNIDEDYRKNLFGTVAKRNLRSDQLAGNSDVETSSFCDEIVAQAFDEIFEGYSGLEDEEDVQEKKHLDNSLPDFGKTSNFLKNYGRSGCALKKHQPLTGHRKSAAPAPPSSNCCSSAATHMKRKIMPFSETKQKASTINHLLGRLKTSPKKNTESSPSKLNKSFSGSLMTTESICPNSKSKFLHKFPAAHLQPVNREVEGRESDEKIDQDFLRGSTVSQSFVRHLKAHKPTKGKAPPVPLETQNGKKPLKTSEALRRVLLFSNKSRSSGDFVPDNFTTTIETRKYYRRLDDDDAIAQPQSNSTARRKVDGCSGLGNTKSLQALSQVVEI